MKICIYRAFPDAYRQSMTVYADELVKSIHPILPLESSILNYFPTATAMATPLVRYLFQYVVYQGSVAFNKADIHHIIDHSYAHLVHSLPPEKTVVTFHDAIGLTAAQGFGRHLLRDYNLTGLKKAAAIICDSLASKQALSSLLSVSESRLHIIYPGLDPIFFQAWEENPFRMLGIPEGFYLLHVGHTGEYKNIPALFHVLAELHKKGLSIQLLKTGTPFSDKQNRLAGDLGIAKHILHLGIVKRPEMPYVYRAAACLLFPSFNEGFGFPLLEAMASGTPTVSSNRGSLPEITSTPNHLFEPTDYQGMSQRILHIIGDATLRQQLIEAGKAKAHQFQWNSAATLALNIYKDLLARGH